MIVIHEDCLEEDTKRLKRIYEDLNDITLLYNSDQETIEAELKNNNDSIVMFLGHGDSRGFLNNLREERIINGSNVVLLKTRTIIGIWCYASEFADLYNLHGFFTSMFISSLSEAMQLGMYNNTMEDILCELDIFCNEINRLLKTKTPLSLWPELLRKSCHKEKDFVRFNYESLVYYD